MSPHVGDEAEGDAPASAPTNRMVVSVIALVGFFVSAYLLAHNLGLTGPVICGTGSCETVQSSAYAWVGPVPVSLIGVLGYAALFAVAFLGLRPGLARSRATPMMLLAGSGLGVVFSAYLTYLEAAVIGAWCQWCVASAILITLAFLACLPEVGRLRVDHHPNGPGEP